jgi:hypothetical protein
MFFLFIELSRNIREGETLPLPLPCLEHQGKVEPEFPAPRAAIDSTKTVVLQKESNRYRR